MPIAELLAQITGEPSPNCTQPMTLPPKRKADESLRRPMGGEKDKMQRTNTADAAANSSRPLSSSQSTKPTTVPGKSPVGSNGAKPLKPSPSRYPDRPVQLPLPKPPKKGSFAEIMARAKTAQAAMGPQVGKIQHKKIEKAPSKREREAMQSAKGKNIERLTGPGGKFEAGNKGHAGKNGVVGKDGKRVNGKKESPVPEKKIKKAALATTGYTGTARPKTAGPNGSKPSFTAPRRPDRDRFQNDRRPSAGARYAYPSEEDEGEEEEPGDYESDASSDMEAAAFEVDEEEETAEKIAKREDAEALREEIRLKKLKEEKKRKLAAMANKRPAQRY